jgi:hypothetical protein
MGKSDSSNTKSYTLLETTKSRAALKRPLTATGAANPLFSNSSHSKLVAKHDIVLNNRPL